MTPEEITAFIEDIRVEGSDLPEVEAKQATGGLPQSIVSTMSAFANTPGGGVLILGLDEKAGYSAVGVSDAVAMQAGIAAKARQALNPPVQFDSGTLLFEGATLVWAKIYELPSSAKPCRVGNGSAYLRSYDGDYPLSSMEEQAFLANRETPMFDRRLVEGATRTDLDDELVRGYIEMCRRSDVLDRFESEEILVRTGVLDTDGHTPTLAGLLALGRYPQQFFPNLVIQASVTAGGRPGDEVRALDTKKFEGPIPVMLDDALRWVQRNIPEQAFALARTGMELILRNIPRKLFASFCPTRSSTATSDPTRSPRRSPSSCTPIGSCSPTRAACGGLRRPSWG